MEQLMNIDDLLIQQVRSVFDGDKHLLYVIPKIMQKVKERELLNFMEEFYELKKNQTVRLGDVFNILIIEKEGEKNEVIRALSRQKRMLLERSETKLMDCAITSILIRSIITLQLNGYETAINCTIDLEDKRIVRLLRTCFREERVLEKKLERLEAVYIEDVATLSLVV